MARYLTKTLTLTQHFSPKSNFKFLPSRSLSTEAQLIEIEVDSSSDVENLMGLKKLEDAIHGIMVQRLAPDWLPFRPGSSYWVPPQRRPDNILQLVGNLTHPLNYEESLSISSSRGWPSSSFLFHGDISERPIPVEPDVQIHANSSSEKTPSEDEE